MKTRLLIALLTSTIWVTQAQAQVTGDNADQTSAQSAAVQDIARYNYLYGLTNKIPPVPGLRTHLNDNGQKVIDLLEPEGATTRSNTAYYVTMDQGKPIKLDQINPSDDGAIADYGSSKVLFPSDINTTPIKA